MMKYILYIVTLLIVQNLKAQELKYYIDFPPGTKPGRGATEEPDSIDTNYFYTYTEIKKIAEPVIGWTKFYNNIDTLDYPQEAKKQKLQTRMTVVYKVDEKGLVDTVYIKSVESHGRWVKCQPCEALIIDYFKNSKWTPGRIGETFVKTFDSAFVEFSIYDPKGKITGGLFGE
jgi:hypothetical protein